jgi:predicted nucleotidyltransferase component of viral defense system
VPTTPERTLIEREELVEKSEEFGLHISDVQRDYVFGWLLSGLYQEDSSDGLVLKGGNALRKAWLPETRFSDDLDFSTRGVLDPERLLTRFNSLCTLVHARTGIRFDLARTAVVKEQHIDASKRVYKMRLYFNDFSGNADHLTLKVRLDVTEGDRLLLPVQTRGLIHPYSDAADCAVDLQVVKLEEALADKLACLITRRYAYDLFDLVYGLFVRSDSPVNRGEVVHTFLRKSAFERSPVTARDLLINTPLDLLGQYWSKIVCPKASLFSFDHALETLKVGVASLFLPFRYGPGHAPAYFPPQLRNAILQAATDLTLLRLVYQGRERLVEPYSLAYTIRRSDGMAQEYFWAYDRTGGRTGPGIKSFIRSGIQGMANTNIAFQPRFPVELSKAPTRGGVSTFAGRSSSRFPAAGRGLRSSGGVTYTIQCPYCGKRFTRKTSNTRLNPHKDRWGSPCSGRSGYRVH